MTLGRIFDKNENGVFVQADSDGELNFFLRYDSCNDSKIVGELVLQGYENDVRIVDFIRKCPYGVWATAKVTESVSIETLNNDLERDGDNPIVFDLFKDIETEYVCLYNPHSEEWLLFDYEEGKEMSAPNYGVAISNGATPDDCISSAVRMWEIDPRTVLIG